MNNEKKIIDKIIADANTKASEILTQARLETDNKLKEAQQEAQKLTDLQMEKAKIEAEKAKAKELSSADMIAKKRILSTKQKLIEEALSQAKQKLITENNETIILKMLKDAKVNNSMEVILSPTDSDKFKKAIEAEGYKVSNETRDILGGFILKDGDIEYNYSFEAIIEVDKEELELVAAQILFN